MANILRGVPSKKEKFPLSVTHPELAKEADGWDPSLVTAGTGKKLAWRCSKNHSWETTPSHRLRGQGCPYCGNKKVLIGYNDLSTTHPNIAKEADGWNPEDFTGGSHKVMNWKCEQGHTWKVAIEYRSRGGTNCPICAGKKVKSGFNDLMSKFPEVAQEAYGWDPATFTASSGKKVEWKCPRGHIYLAPIYSRTSKDSTGCPICANRKVLQGFNDLATTHPQIAKEAFDWDPSSVSAGTGGKKYKWVCADSHIFESYVYSRVAGVSCGICSNHQILKGVNDLATTHPELAIDAAGWDPSTFGAGSEKKLKWNCKVGHTYTTSIKSRVIQNTKCLVCGNREVLIGFNDLQTTHPELALQALGWDPTTKTGESHSRVRWRCPEAHEWISVVNSRTRGRGCPSCAQTGFDPNEDGFLYFISHPYWEMLQIGITNNPEKRLSQHRKLGWELLELRGPMDGHLTQQWETAILRMLKAKGADLSNEKIAGKFDGYSEAWSKNKFEVKSIKELTRLTEEFEERK